MKKPCDWSKFSVIVSPDDSTLVREVGRALVMTHDYARAVNFYERTLSEDPRLVSFRFI